MGYTRRKLLGTTAVTVSLAGCADDSPETTATTERSTATRTTVPPTDTPTESPTETETDTPTGSATVRFWTRAVTAVFAGEVSSETVGAAFDRELENWWSYQADWGQERVTYFVSPSTVAVAEMRESFEKDEELTVKYVYRGVGEEERLAFRSSIRDQAAERTGIDPDEVSESAITVSGQQYLEYSAPTAVSALVPTLPEMELQRPNEEEPIVGPDGFAVESGFNILERFEGRTNFLFSLSKRGRTAFREAVEDAEDERMHEAFFRLVAGGNDFGTFGVSANLEERIEGGDWNGEISLALDRQYDGEDTVTRLTGLPPVPFECVVVDA